MPQFGAAGWMQECTGIKMLQTWLIVLKWQMYVWSTLTNTHRGRSTVACLYWVRKVHLGHINTICIFSQIYTYTYTLLVFSGQLSREHSTIMSCSTFMTDGKCAARRCSAPPFPSPLQFTRLARPSTRRPGRCPCTARYQVIGTSRREEELLGAEAVEKPPHPPHQYCSLTWWKLTPANIFHHVIGREDQMPWLDMPTLLPVQMMTQSSLHYSWLL